MKPLVIDMAKLGPGAYGSARKYLRPFIDWEAPDGTFWVEQWKLDIYNGLRRTELAHMPHLLSLQPADAERELERIIALRALGDDAP